MNEFAWSWNEPRPAIDPARFTEHRQETETDLQRAIRYYLEADKKALEEQEAKEEAFFAQSTVGKNSWHPLRKPDSVKSWHKASSASVRQQNKTRWPVLLPH